MQPLGPVLTRTDSAKNERQQNGTLTREKNFATLWKCKITVLHSKSNIKFVTQTQSKINNHNQKNKIQCLTN